MTAKTKARTSGLMIIGLIAAISAGGWYLWHENIGRLTQSTDNAYVQGPVVPVTAQVPGTVISVAADNTDFVTQGQVLVRLDPADANLALDQAQARLAQTVREVRALFSNNDTLLAQISARKANVGRAAGDVRQLTQDVARRKRLAKSGVVSTEELSRIQNRLAAARSSLRAAQAAVSVARQQLVSSRALTADTTVMNHPKVLLAAATVREALLSLERMSIRAPVDGYVAKRSVQPGQRAQPGMPMLSVIPLNKVWVEANFKESQLQEIRIGQPVELVADVYGDQTIFNGVVAGLGAGTGAAFALLPAQNATGNWIKVIQRVPVRISLDPNQLSENPLQLGLSMKARVTVSDSSGPRLAQAPRRAPAETYTSVASIDDKVRLMVTDIITRNLPAPALTTKPAKPAKPAARLALSRKTVPARVTKNQLPSPAELAGKSRSLVRSEASIKAARQALRDRARRMAEAQQVK